MKDKFNEFIDKQYLKEEFIGEHGPNI